MWSRTPIFCWPSVWLASWLLGAATTMAYRLPTTLAPLAPHRLRTPLLSLHVSTLKPSPRASIRAANQATGAVRVPERLPSTAHPD